MKKKLGYEDKDDGCFWMAFEDFILHYRNIYICRVFGEGWHSARELGEWKGKTAGGCSNYGTWRDNPKFRLKIKGRVRIMLTLEQQDARGTDAEKCPIGFKLYKADSGGGFQSFSVAGTKVYSYDREVCFEDDLTEQGSAPYFLIPSTFEPGLERRFSVKAFWRGDADAVSLYKEGSQ